MFPYFSGGSSDISTYEEIEEFKKKTGNFSKVVYKV